MAPANGLTALNAADFWNELTKNNVSFAANINFDNGITIKGTTNSGLSGGAIQHGAIHTLGGISAAENIVAGGTLYCKNDLIVHNNVTATSGAISGKTLTGADSITCTNGVIQSKGANGVIDGATVKSGLASLSDGAISGTTLNVTGGTTMTTLSTTGLLSATGGITSGADVNVPQHTVSAKKVMAVDVCGTTVQSGSASLNNGVVAGTTLKAASLLDVSGTTIAANGTLSVRKGVGTVNAKVVTADSATVSGLQVNGNIGATGTVNAKLNGDITSCTNANITNLTVETKVDAPTVKVGVLEVTNEFKHLAGMTVSQTSDSKATMDINGTLKVGSSIHMSEGVVSANHLAAANKLTIGNSDTKLDEATLKDLNGLFTGFNMGDDSKDGIYKSMAKIAQAVGVTTQGTTHKLTQLNAGLTAAINDVSFVDASGQPSTNNIASTIVDNSAFAGSAAKIMELFNILNTRINNHFKFLSASQLAQNTAISALVSGAVNASWTDVSAGLVAEVATNRNNLATVTSSVNTNKANISAADASINQNITNIAVDVAKLANYTTTAAFDASYTALETKVNADINAHTALNDLVRDLSAAHVPQSQLLDEITKLQNADTFLHSTIQSRLEGDEASLTKLRSDLQDISNNLATLSNTVKEAGTSHTTLATAVNTYNATVESIESALGTDYVNELQIFTHGNVTKTVVAQVKAAKQAIMNINDELETKLKDIYDHNAVVS